jgi:hypothetical protein
VFVLYASRGDAWLFEIAENDAIQLVRDGEVIPASIDENPETIEVDWTYRFAVTNRQLVLTPYNDTHQEVCFDQKTTHQLSASMRRIRKKCSPEQLRQVHMTV